MIHVKFYESASSKAASKQNLQSTAFSAVLPMGFSGNGPGGPSPRSLDRSWSSEFVLCGERQTTH